MAIQIISYKCTLTTRLGQIISSTIAQNVLLHPEAKNIPLKALSEAMRDLTKGETRQIFLCASEAYGFYDPKLVLTRRLEDSDLATPFKIGEQVQMIKDGQSIWMRVIQVSAETVTLDGNHPLAGQDLIFEIQALDAREATPNEIDDAVPMLPLIH
jgi:FKBP-type peptidyl-prolyl cis-trans isomerase SlyD